MLTFAFILLTYIDGYNSGSQSTIEFATLAQCQVAEAAVNKIQWTEGAKAKAVCIRVDRR